MDDTHSKPRSRFLRISLRGLLLLVLVVAMALGWMKHEAHRQAVAVSALEKLGCTVYYGNRVSPTLLERTRKLLGEGEWRDVAAVFADKSQITDAGLVHLQGFDHLSRLNLAETQVTDAGLVQLQRLAHLRCLWLDRTQVTDAGLVHLLGMTQLGYLEIHGTRATGSGLQKLQEALPDLSIGH